uniref:Uncharacterized protein n=1 Tax=Arundo donax TaxID=35708 RepID=A0A0A9AXE6_ARUDO
MRSLVEKRAHMENLEDWRKYCLLPNIWSINSRWNRQMKIVVENSR